MIKYLIMDVDGTLTDGKIYMGPNGEAMKAFSIKDGYVVNYILKPAGIKPVIITARTSSIVQNRCKELGITEVYQGKTDKQRTLMDIVGDNVMGKMYALFVSEEVLEPSMDNEMILTGVGHNKGRRLDRTLGALIKSDFAKKEILSEYMKIIDIIFCKLNIRNCIMHGLGETFDYLNIGIVAIMFQLLWDVAACEIFND